MESLLGTHLRRLNSSADSLASYPFADTKIFLNSILKSRDIVSLIRDTDAHERALFTVSSNADCKPQPLLSEADLSLGAGPRNTAVHSVLGDDLVRKLRKRTIGTSEGRTWAAAGDGSDVDVDLLLLGAEKLTSVYQIRGANERIARARERYEQLTESITNYEALVESQRAQLNLLNHLEVGYDQDMVEPASAPPTVTDMVIEEENAAIRSLEERKEQLEIKIKNIDRKLSSVYRGIG